MRGLGDRKVGRNTDRQTERKSVNQTKSQWKREILKHISTRTRFSESCFSTQPFEMKLTWSSHQSEQKTDLSPFCQFEIDLSEVEVKINSVEHENLWTWIKTELD